MIRLIKIKMTGISGLLTLTADVIVQFVFFCQMTLKNAALDANAVVSALKAAIRYVNYSHTVI